MGCLEMKVRLTERQKLPILQETEHYRKYKPDGIDV